MDKELAFLIIVMGPVTFIAGALTAMMTQNWDVGFFLQLLVAVGTLSAVVVALFQAHSQRADAASQRYLDAATKRLETAIHDFEAIPDPEGRPPNDRLHWLNFARGLEISRDLGTQIRQPEHRQVWRETEQYWRSHLHRTLVPDGDSYPDSYYGYTTATEMHKNEVQVAGEWSPLSEPSLVTVYRWVRWPTDYPDPLNRALRFSDEEIDKMNTFGPRGLGRFLAAFRAYKERRANNVA